MLAFLRHIEMRTIIGHSFARRGGGKKCDFGKAGRPVIASLTPDNAQLNLLYIVAFQLGLPGQDKCN